VVWHRRSRRRRRSRGIRITGRIKDLIIRGGENLPVAEIESLLAGHDEVAEVAVVAVPDRRLGERACAVVVPADGAVPALASLIEALAAAGMTKQFWPERLLLVRSLPRTVTGKLARAELRVTVSRQLAGASLRRDRARRGVSCATG
jgi:cyclohexanecarboxylate-CoA ligase